MKYLTTLLLFVSSFCLGQLDSIPSGDYGVDYNVTDSKGKKQGDWIRVFEDGSVYYFGQFKNDAPYGVFRYYYDSQELMTLATHSEDGLTETKSYRKDGSVISIGSYLNQKKVDEWFLYDDEGKIVSVENYKDDVLNGLRTVYYKNGQISEKAFFENGEKEGEWEEFFENGRIKGKGTYSAGKQHGLVVTYNSPNVKLYEGQLKDGIAIGEWKYYLGDGRLKLRILYDDFGSEIRRKLENGESEEFYDSGIPKSYYEFRHGKMHGLFSEYYDLGEFIVEEILSTEPGQPIEYMERLVNTQLKVEGEYRMGLLEGEIVYYNEDGTIEKREYYENGILIED